MASVRTMGAGQARDGFFVHHGFWAPGVRLFRRLGFPAKAALITLVFMLPLLLLLGSYLRGSQATIRFAEHERAGVALMRGLEPWLTQVQKQRRLVLQGAQAGADLAAVDGARTVFAALVAQHPDGIDLAAELAEALKRHQALQAMPAGTDRHTLAPLWQAYVEALQTLRRSALDQSNLTLDPDQDTYYLMLLSTDVLAQAIEALSHTRAQAGLVPPPGELEHEAALRELYAHWQAARRAPAAIEATLQRAALGDAALSTRLVPAAARERTLAFLNAAQDSWFAVGSFYAGLKELEAPGQAAVDALRALDAQTLAELDLRLVQRAQRVRQQQAAVLAVSALSLLLAAYLFHSFYRVMQGGLAEVGRHLQAMTDGDLTTTPRPWGRDEAAGLMLLLANMQGALRTMVAQVRTASDGLVQASHGIADDAQALSARTDQTAASLQRSAATMEQIGTTVQHTAAQAHDAHRIASDNARQAEHGGQVMQQMLRTMDQIQAASHRIGDIVGTIDGIAFQTNILALNAAVEAARAGESGRGFAVVAAEVRTLARRSADAARQIRQLIDGSVAQVDQGNSVAREAGSAIAEVVAGAGRIRGVLDGIACGAREQSLGVGQMGQTVQELDRATQQNASMVQHTADAANTLREQAQALAEQVARFRLPL